jgi:hypothetical protein
MASRVNSNFAYINLINGETVWERLRIVRNFLEDRMVAKKMQSAQEKKRLVILAKIEEAVKKSDILAAEIELEEYDAQAEQQKDGYKKLDEEIEFLIRYEAELASIAEQSRIEGKTDDEMYQINMVNEVILRNLRKIETERVASIIGCSIATADEAMKVPQLKQKLINTATAMSIPVNDQNKGYIEELIKNGIDFNNIPMSVHEELELNKKLMLQ